MISEYALYVCNHTALFRCPIQLIGQVEREENVIITALTILCRCARLGAWLTLCLCHLITRLRKKRVLAIIFIEAHPIPRLFQTLLDQSRLSRACIPVLKTSFVKCELAHF